MDFRTKYQNASVAELKAAHERINSEIGGYKADDGTVSDYRAVEKLLDECDYLRAQITLSEPSTIPYRTLATASAPVDFHKIGQDIQAMVAARAPAHFDHPRIGQFPIGRVDARIARFMNAATGLNEGIGSDGGFLVGDDMESAIMRSVFSGSPLLNIIRNREISAGANTLTINVIDETSRADASRWGGTTGYWLAEAGTKTASKPKYRQLKLALKKVIALTYATDELLMDASALGQEIIENHAEELRFKMQDAIINGDGAGKPLGILSSPATIQVAKEAGQVADTIVWENITKMFSRYVGGPGVWLINRDCLPSLYQMNVAVGTGGVPVYLPASQGMQDAAAQRPLSTLLGWPVLEIEQCATLGDVGDIILMDPMAYIAAVKRGIQSAMSIHVNFLQDETVIRSVARIDGQPMLASAITPFKGSATRSPFVTLAVR